jgi:hypothetical protein
MGFRRSLLASAGLALAVLAADGAGTRGEEPATQAFLHEVEDLPLMPGLRETADAAVVFESPPGRIVVAYATGAVGGEAVFSFYAESLPQLGWRQEERGLFRRDGETLTLEVVGPAAGGGAGAVTVRFSLFSESPQPAASQ